MGIANVVALKQVVKGHETAPVREVARAINIKLRLADQNENEALSHREEAGGMLVSLRARVEADGGDWWKFAHDHFDRERRELEKLMVHVSKAAVAKSAVKLSPHKSDRAIAAEIGVSHPTVRAARSQLEENLPVEKRIGKDGKARKMPAPATHVTAKLADTSPRATHAVKLAGTSAPSHDPLIEQALQLVKRMTAAQRKTFTDIIIEGSYK